MNIYMYLQAHENFDESTVINIYMFVNFCLCYMTQNHLHFQRDLSCSCSTLCSNLWLYSSFLHIFFLSVSSDFLLSFAIIMPSFLSKTENNSLCLVN